MELHRSTNAYICLNFTCKIAHVLIGERSYYSHERLDGGTELLERTFGHAVYSRKPSHRRQKTLCDVLLLHDYWKPSHRPKERKNVAKENKTLFADRKFKCEQLSLIFHRCNFPCSRKAVHSIQPSMIKAKVLAVSCLPDSWSSFALSSHNRPKTSKLSEIRHLKLVQLLRGTNLPLGVAAQRAEKFHVLPSFVVSPLHGALKGLVERCRCEWQA
jgi:hypothetical protein